MSNSVGISSKYEPLLRWFCGVLVFVRGALCGLGEELAAIHAGAKLGDWQSSRVMDDLEWDWPKEYNAIMEQMRANITLSEGARRAGDYGACRAYLRDIERLCWNARNEIDRSLKGKQ
jgi:hypothetical protein